MLGVEMSHLDDFTLLRLVANDLDAAEQTSARRHLASCARCREALGEIEELDKELKALAGPSSRPDWDLEELPPGDPFRRRPLPRMESGRVPDRTRAISRAVEASEEGKALATSLLDAARTSPHDLARVLPDFSTDKSANRFGLLYALQNAGREIAENPGRFFAFAEAALKLLRDTARFAGDDREGERSVPGGILFGQAHQLAGQACLWTGDFEKAGSHLALAYRFFGLAGEEVSLAITEHLEAQRRSFSDANTQALALARRAVMTFESLGLEDLVARARMSVAIALAGLKRSAEAVDEFRSVLHVFEEHSLWSNYVSAVNCIGVCLVEMGRLDEARREYAKALKRLSRDRHRGLVGYVRHGLAEVFFAAGRYKEAALSLTQANRIYAECGMTQQALMASLLEIESWARSGDLGRARHRLEIFEVEAAKQTTLDPTVVHRVREALAGAAPDFQRIAELRQGADRHLKTLPA